MDSYAARALYLARGGYATPGFVDDQPEEEYPDGARPLTIYRNPSRTAPAGAIDVGGDQGPSYDQMGNVTSPGRNSDPIVDAAMRAIPARSYAKDPELLAQEIQDYKRKVAEREATPEYYRQMTHYNISPPLAPVQIEGGFIGKRAIGEAPYDNAEARSKFFQTLYDMKTLPLYAAGSVFPPAAGLGMALDTAEGVAAGSPTQVAMSAFGAPGKILKYGAAPLIAATGMLSPDEARAAKLPKIPKAAKAFEGINGAVGPVGQPMAAGSPNAVQDAVDFAKNVAAPQRSIVDAATSVIPTTEAEAARALAVARQGTPQSDIVDNLTGAFAPEKAPVRGETGKEMLRMQRMLLTPQEKDVLNDLRAKNPDFSRASRFMLPEELRTLINNPRQIEPMMRLLDVIPSSAHMASLAKAGTPKQGWYRGSTQALIEVFGKDDAPRFAALLAATSPQTSVESNLMNTLNIWKNWEASGRPTDPSAIKRVMGASVQGNKGEESILGSWLPNTIAALSADDPLKIVLSGPKVNSFFRNLADDVYRVTNDAWISNATKIDQSLLGGGPTAKQLAEGNPGLSPGYLALNSRQREAGNMVRMLPSEAQETIWSVAMPMMEGARKAGITSQELLQRGMLTPELIAGTPDFSTLLKSDPRYSRVIRDMGRGEQLDRLQPYEFPRSMPEMTSADNRNLEKTARTLDDLRKRRDTESRALFQGFTPKQKTTFAHVTADPIPGRGTGIAENIIDAPLNSRIDFSKRIGSAFQDETKSDRLNKAADLKPIPTATMVSSWRPEGKGPLTGMATGLQNSYFPNHPLEIGKGYAVSQEVPIRRVQGQEIIDPAVERALIATSTLRGALTGQHGMPHHAMVADPKGSSAHVEMPKGMKKPEVMDRIGVMSALDKESSDGMAMAHTGRGLGVLGFGGPLNANDIQRIQDLSGGQKVTQTRNIAGPGAYVDLKEEFLAPHGERHVTGRMIGAYDTLSPKQQRAIDVELRHIAGELLPIYEAQNAKGNSVRGDFLKMLTTLHNGGMAALKQAYNAREYLPALAAFGIIPAISGNGERTSGQQ